MPADFRTLCTTRLEEARTLLAAGQPSGAYYLTGYAVECALKACITRDFRAFSMPNKRLVEKAHTHDLAELLKLANLGIPHDAALSADPHFAVNWATVKDWSEASRYEEWSIPQASDLFLAASDVSHGVVPWIQQQW